MNKNNSEMLKLYKPKTLYWYNRIKFFLFPFIKLEMLVPKAGFIIDLGCIHGLLANFLGITSEKINWYMIIIKLKIKIYVQT